MDEYRSMRGKGAGESDEPELREEPGEPVAAPTPIA
jgi:hypothetical protein